jgi:hypothetical protein
MRTLLAASLTLALLTPALAAQPAPELCPRGSYSTRDTAAGPVLVGSLTLPTGGHQVDWVQGPERLLPPVFEFRCLAPTGVVLQVVTTYTPETPVPFAGSALAVYVRDAEGTQQVALPVAAPPPTLPASCKANGDCAADQFCNKINCGATGVCQVRPQICTQVYLPVTGCDGKVYSNTCVAHSHGVPVRSQFVLPKDLQNQVLRPPLVPPLLPK